MTASEIAEVVVRTRRAKGWSQRRLAAHIDVSHSYISHIEAGRRMPSLETLNLIAQALGLRLTLEQAGP